VRLTNIVLFSQPEKMKNSRHTIIFMIAIGMLLSVFSCSEYNKVLKSTDLELKYTKAVEFYNNGEYYKSLPILEELIGLTRGSQRAEDVYYYYAKSQFGVKDYYMANYYLKSFNKTFTLSPKAEECLFLAAECSYQLSPSYSLDQADTKNAINEYQLFLDKYPGSNLRDSANHQIERLNAKLELKAYENATVYAKTLKHKAAASALKEFLKEYPESKYKEEAMFLIVKSNFLLADGSIESKKLERMRATSESYRTFAAAFPQSKFLNEAEAYFKRSEKQIEKLNQK
jgi:outer membrane protein assembly factor BamD